MAQEEDALEATLGYANFSEGEDRLGWLMNVCAVRHRPPRTAGAPRTRANAKTFEFETATTDSRMRIRRVMRRVVDRDGRREMLVIKRGRARALGGFRDVDGWRYIYKFERLTTRLKLVQPSQRGDSTTARRLDGGTAQCDVAHG